jgi:hypothetical protein
MNKLRFLNMPFNMPFSVVLSMPIFSAIIITLVQDILTDARERLLMAVTNPVLNVQSL